MGPTGSSFWVHPAMRTAEMTIAMKSTTTCFFKRTPLYFQMVLCGYFSIVFVFFMNQPSVGLESGTFSWIKDECLSV